MKSTDLSAVTLVPLVMAASSLFSMIGMLQIDKIVNQTLYRYGLQFSYAWAKPYWDITAFVFGMGWFNIGLAAAFQLYVVTYGRREAKRFATDVKKEISKMETEPTEKVEEQDRQTPTPVTASESQQKKEEPQIAVENTSGQRQTTNPNQVAPTEEQKAQESEPSKVSETEQKDTKPGTEEKREETPIIIGVPQEELQTAN